jgi:hypothetical protein
VDHKQGAGDGAGGVSVSFVDELIDLLREANIRPTLDFDADLTRPCVLCATTEEPRDLIVIGKYTRRMGGGLIPGDAIRRPMCARCREATEDPTRPTEPGPPDPT